MKMNRTLPAVLAVVAALAAGHVAAIAEYPKLAGQYPEYMAKALRDYKSGARKNPIMAGMAAGLTQKDIDDVSAYFASLPPVLSSRM